MDTLEKLKYPIGKFTWPNTVSEAELRQAIQTISDLPAKLKMAAGKLSEDLLDTPYRPEGWTVRQVIHHVADSHMNALIRFKLALTEDTPTIKPYLQAKWAELPDSKSLPVEVSISLLEYLHQRWVGLMNHLQPSDWDRQFIHPEHHSIHSLRQTVIMYAWHCEHHLGHVRIVAQTN
jgi:hypothetical protein